MPRSPPLSPAPSSCRRCAALAATSSPSSPSLVRQLPRAATIDFMREHGEADGACMPQQGPLSVAVPGFVDGCFALLDRFGSRPFADLAQPAIGYAADGFPLSPLGVQDIADCADLLRQHPTSAAIFLSGGAAPEPGTMLRQTDLARTLDQVARGGRHVFYNGDIASRIGEFMAANGGVLAADDFTDHATDVAPPLATTYRGYTVYETTLPTQGFLVLEALNIVENADISRLGVSSAAGIHIMAEAMKLAFADRLAYAGDPRHVATPLSTLIAKSWAAERYRHIDPARASDEVAAGELRPGDTTSLCVVDSDGLMISLIFSLSGGFGSGVVAGDTGILLNNRAGNCFSLVEGHPNRFAPGKKTMHTLNCYLIADPDGNPVLVGGTPGGDFQPQWNLQIIAGMIDAGLDVQAAIEQPRWMVWPGTYPISVDHPFELRVEDRLGGAVEDELERLGHRLVRLEPWAADGYAQVIACDPASGVLVGGSDPRGEGLALGL
ncbi:MAG TPA: gamma-glutamyltransferase family protein [Thermomicrobiales bacterium]|nr:gamma-glutamyltransferase family protein [Thermomicrobiales bacterium]